MKLLRIALKESKKLVECGYSYWGSVHTAVTLLWLKRMESRYQPTLRQLSGSLSNGQCLMRDSSFKKSNPLEQSPERTQEETLFREESEKTEETAQLQGYCNPIITWTFRSQACLAERGMETKWRG